jgi:ABC-2 type transport system permease protein
MLPFAGALFTAIAAGCFTNLYGDDGSALWLTLVTPRVEGADVRGRQWAWVLVVGPVGMLLTLVLTAASGQGWSWPWVLAGEPALIGGAAGLLVLVSAVSAFPLSADGGPTPQRQLKVNLMLIVLPLPATMPALVLLVLGTTVHAPALEWSAVPVGVGWGGLLWWGLGRIARGRLESAGPELFAKVRQSV